MCKHNAKIIVNLPYLLRFMHGHGRSSGGRGCVVLTAMGLKYVCSQREGKNKMESETRKTKLLSQFVYLFVFT